MRKFPMFIMLTLSALMFTGVAFAGYRVSGAGVADANGLYCEMGPYNRYAQPGTAWELWYANGNWWIDDEGGITAEATYYHLNDDSTPPLTGWGANQGFDPAPTLSEEACGPIQVPTQVPTLPKWGMIILTCLLLGVVLYTRRRQTLP